ncbi:MAG: type II toxin-antitoxin system PemK/MazF family toxin [Nitriliruptorales bacterium]|nr:type II toxin-antitoxin system PemK/MazF family toxin [Nitriliruptorales bacterium]
MRRGQVWLADVGRKPRPVLVVTRGEVLDVRANVTVAEITTQVRGLTVEVPIDIDAGIDQASVINCDGLHTVSQRRLTRRLGTIDDETLDEVCGAIAIALGCDGN